MIGPRGLSVCQHKLSCQVRSCVFDTFVWYPSAQAVSCSHACDAICLCSLSVCMCAGVRARCASSFSQPSTPFAHPAATCIAVPGHVRSARIAPALLALQLCRPLCPRKNACAAACTSVQSLPFVPKGKSRPARPPSEPPAHPVTAHDLVPIVRLGDRVPAPSRT